MGTALGLSLPIAVTLANSCGLDLHRDGPPAVGGVRADDHRVAASPPGVSVFEAATSLIVLTLLYAVLAVVELGSS